MTEIEIKRIRTSDVAYYNYMEALLTASFPEDEYRELEVMRQYTDNQPIFYNNIILHKNKQVGFVTYWDLGEFYYVEHFAIDPNMRNGGYGQKLLALLSTLLDRPIVLEVEHPTEDMAKRRINFYKRQGFELWENEYFQPPYKSGFDSLPMYIMAKGELDSSKDFEHIKSKIHRVVYGVA